MDIDVTFLIQFGIYVLIWGTDAAATQTFSTRYR